jgi:hypothetical protein
MSKLSGFKRKLDPKKVWLAQQVAAEKIKIARQVVIEQAKKDAQFAADVLKAVGDNLPKEIKDACEESVREACEKAVNSASIADADKFIVDALMTHAESKKIGGPIIGGDTTHELTEVVQLDGGGVIMVRPEEAPGYPKDGEKLISKPEPVFAKS